MIKRIYTGSLDTTRKRQSLLPNNGHKTSTHRQLSSGRRTRLSGSLRHRLTSVIMRKNKPRVLLSSIVRDSLSRTE
jgi:hypothetical protein